MTQRRIYQDECPYFVTFRTKDNYPFFEKTKSAKLLSYIILEAGRIKRYCIISYQIMPDHVHILVYQKQTSATTESCARRKIKTNPEQVSAPAMGGERDKISQLMYTIKSYFIYELRKKYNIPQSIWQRRFHTRIIDNEEYLKTIARYIKYNPIKASLPSKYHKMPYQYFDWESIKELF